MIDKLIGNNHIKEVFKRMFEKDRIPRSLLFVGENGIGKKQFALETAKSFVCHNLQNAQACDVCSACKRAEKFSLPKSNDKDDNEKIFFSEHADLGLLRPAGKFITVNQIRELERESNFRPFEAKARIFIIDEADRMNDAAANALLKTLEEPSESSYIFLITSRPMSLLQTIRSRCQIIRFAPLKSAEIESYLLQTKQFSPNDAELLARLSHGSLGNALQLDLGKYREQREAMLKALEGLTIKLSRATLLKTAEEMNDAKLKDEYETRLEIFQNLIHDVWSLKFGKSEILNIDIKPQLLRLAEHSDKTKLSNWLIEIETLRENFTVNLNKKIATDALFMKMAA
jgi:DNA polymerase III subunit delta'